MKTIPKSTKVWLVHTLPATLLILAVSTGSLRAQNYQGAANVLAQAARKEANPAANTQKDEFTKLRDKLTALRQTSASLEPVQAAHESRCRPLPAAATAFQKK